MHICFILKNIAVIEKTQTEPDFAEVKDQLKSETNRFIRLDTDL